MVLFTDGARREINVKSHITSEELFQHMKAVSGLGDATKLEQWRDIYGFWATVDSAEKTEVADGAKFRVVCMCTVTITCELGKQVVAQGFEICHGP